MTPEQRYQRDIEQQLISPDQEQRHIVASFQRLHHQLLASDSTNVSIAESVRRWIVGASSNPAELKGIYLWGGVGRGKTYLMDLFFDCLPLERKQRTHFHRFMQHVHGELTKLQGERNPLDRVADQIASQAQVLCFDEFFVLDIGDAMILGGLLDALFRRNVILVTTSNIFPDGLYENGLQRDRFVPAIELIKQHTEVIEIKAGIDYRLRSLAQATLYHCPIDAQTDELLLKSFYELAPDKSEAKQDEVVEILDRGLQSRFCADDVIWFEFNELCAGPRAASDYVELARLYHALLLSDVPQLDDSRSDQVRRFVSLVDELYDRRVKLIMAAAVPIESLYQGQRVAFEFERTRSRLMEMQSHEYLGFEHRG